VAVRPTGSHTNFFPRNRPLLFHFIYFILLLFFFKGDIGFKDYADTREY
jgi:hypothetical protein